MKHNKQTIFLNSVLYVLTDTIFKSLSTNARFLLLILCHLRYKFNQSEPFFRSDTDLAKDSNIPLRTLKQTKAELKLYPNLLTIKQKAFKVKGEILGDKHLTTYQLLF